MPYAASHAFEDTGLCREFERFVMLALNSLALVAIPNVNLS